jgi:hypothetical protein
MMKENTKTEYGIIVAQMWKQGALLRCRKY